jgi:hypothetical protein
VSTSDPMAGLRGHLNVTVRWCMTGTGLNITPPDRKPTGQRQLVDVFMFPVRAVLFQRSSADVRAMLLRIRDIREVTGIHFDTRRGASVPTPRDRSRGGNPVPRCRRRGVRGWR